MSISARQMVWMALLGALLLAFTRTPGIEEAWQRNRVSLAIWHQVDIPRSLADLEDRLYPKPGGGPAALAQQVVSPCQDLWISYLWASTDLRRAGQAARRAQACPRPEFVYRWAGTLAWLEGDAAGARRAWAKLRPYALAQWGRDLALQEETALGRTLLEIARDLNDTGQPLRPAAQALLFRTLGDLEQQSGESEKATAYYKRAWAASGGNYLSSYLLGTSYATQGNCQRAIEVMEYSLQHKPEQTRPQLDTRYLLRLGECHLRVGNYTQANRYLNAAQTLIDAYDLKNQRTWLDHIKEKLLQTP